MFAVIEMGGKQYLVTEGQHLSVEKTGEKPGATLTIDRVLLTTDGKSVNVGQPTVKGAKVTATVDKQFRGTKVTVLKYKPKVRYRKKLGHRQTMDAITIKTISA